MTPGPIYLDYASTTPLDPRVGEAMQQAMRAAHANPASQHQAGRAARKQLESAREVIAKLLHASTEGMEADRLLFTSGGTEANNLALLGFVGREPSRLIVSAIEHPSIMGPAEQLARRTVQVDRIRVNPHGVLDLDHLQQLLATSPSPALVSVMLANNETGVVQPIAEVARMCREQAVPVHTDAIQAIGKMPVDFRTLGVDALSIAPHKFHGPLGIGGLLLRPSAKLEPQLFGGFQQAGLRPGTEALVPAIGFSAALQLAVSNERSRVIRGLRDQFEAQLRARLDDVIINGEAAERVGHITNVAFLGCDRQQLFLALDFAGVYCSTGSACASGSSEPSPVLRAMGLPEEVVSSSLRFSFSAPTTAADIEQAVGRIVKCVNDLRTRKSARK